MVAALVTSPVLAVKPVVGTKLKTAEIGTAEADETATTEASTPARLSIRREFVAILRSVIPYCAFPVLGLGSRDLADSAGFSGLISLELDQGA